MSWSEDTIQKVWEKGKIVANNDKDVWRKDECGAWIGRQYYGNRSSTYGWEIDHITSSDHGGSDNLSNLRPLQWENNLSKSSGRLVCAVTADGTSNKNIR
jgi:5-methylcytosine-specific restriction endonuclease McrA